jgi:lipopolysaccharide/colanic/teichoic acid biosynthesis glycosyltransferase
MSPAPQLNRSTSAPIAAGCPAWKCVLDWIISAVLLAPSAVVIFYAMVLVRLTSRGPAFYSQTRLGLHGRPFKIFKIRTMYHDCERLTGPQWSRPGDPRVTPIGRILRATHIDELPQLWNVLRGEMSLVGPRPERPELAAGLERELPGYQDRLAVRPGVAGLAQVQLPPDIDIESVRRKLACDKYYIRHLTLWLDLRIIVGTAMGALGLPFSASRNLLRIPSVEVVEYSLSGPSAEGDNLPRCIEPTLKATCGWYHVPGGDFAERTDRHPSGEISTAPQGVEPMPQVNPA